MAKRKTEGRHHTAAERGGDQVAQRICLGCDRMFLSEGPWNRRCPACCGKDEAKRAGRSAERHHVNLDRRSREWQTLVAMGASLAVVT